jgi:hypothetical protein
MPDCNLQVVYDFQEWVTRKTSALPKNQKCRFAGFPLFGMRLPFAQTAPRLTLKHGLLTKSVEGFSISRTHLTRRNRREYLRADGKLLF